MSARAAKEVREYKSGDGLRELQETAMADCARKPDAVSSETGLSYLILILVTPTDGGERDRGRGETHM